MAQNHGIKVSRIGYDVRTASIKELAMSSKFNYLKIHASGIITITGNYVDIAHSLGYIPAFACWYGYPPQTSEIFPIPNCVDVWSAHAVAWADKTYLHIDLFGKVEDPLVVYYIYKEQIS